MVAAVIGSESRARVVGGGSHSAYRKRNVGGSKPRPIFDDTARTQDTCQGGTGTHAEVPALRSAQAARLTAEDGEDDALAQREGDEERRQRAVGEELEHRDDAAECSAPAQERKEQVD